MVRLNNARRVTVLPYHAMVVATVDTTVCLVLALFVRLTIPYHTVETRAPASGQVEWKLDVGGGAVNLHPTRSGAAVWLGQAALAILHRRVPYHSPFTMASTRAPGRKIEMPADRR